MGTDPLEIFSTTTSGNKFSGSLTATTVFTTTCINSYKPSKTIYNFNGTYTVPPGVNSITVETWGGGASGGGGKGCNPQGCENRYLGCGKCSATLASCRGVSPNYCSGSCTMCSGGTSGGGGGGGGYGKQTFNVTSGSSYSIIVGGAGVTSSFGTLISATGGSGMGGGTSNATINAPGAGGAGGGHDIAGGAGGAGGNGGAGGGGGGGANAGGGAGTVPGGGGGGGFWYGITPGGAGAKGRVTITPSSLTTVINSVSTTKIVTVTSSEPPGQEPKPTELKIDISVASTSVSYDTSTDITWSSSGYDYCTTTKKMGTGPLEIFSTSLSGTLTSKNLTLTTDFVINCKTKDGVSTDSHSQTVVVGPEEKIIDPDSDSGLEPTISTCRPSQDGGEIYSDETTKWTVTLNPSGGNRLQTKWMGTEIPQTAYMEGLNIYKIYRSVYGLENPAFIHATTTGIRVGLDGKNYEFASHCYATTTVKGTGGSGGQF